MKYIGIRQPGSTVTLSNAVLHSTPSGGGLYMPQRLPVIPAPFFMNFGGMSFDEIAYVLANQLFGEDVESASLKRVVDEAFNFDVPLVQISENIYVMELFHGPTLTFKDFGARFMARLLSHLHTGAEMQRSKRSGKLHVLVATNGSTGSAIANGFAGISNVEVYILFPRGHAGRQQEKQFTTLGGNIHALEVQGTIDDCHSLVSQAFADPALNAVAALTSANSENIARLLPQSFYYFYAMALLTERIGRKKPITIAVPAGNLGNVCAGIAAANMGLEYGGLIACENANSFLTDMLAGRDNAAPRAIPTLACAADKGRPSNIDRLKFLCGGDAAGISRRLSAVSVDDAGIIASVNDCYQTTGYTIDPHGAMAWKALKDNLKPGQPGLIMATGHPAKSLTAMSAITGRAMDLPLQLTRFMNGIDHRRPILPTYPMLRDFIFNNL